MKDKSGGSKGFGYVDFEGAESVTFALASQGDEMKLSGRILEVPPVYLLYPYKSTNTDAKGATRCRAPDLLRLMRRTRYVADVR